MKFIILHLSEELQSAGVPKEYAKAQAKIYAAMFDTYLNDIENLNNKIDATAQQLNHKIDETAEQFKESIEGICNQLNKKIDSTINQMDDTIRISTERLDEKIAITIKQLESKLTVRLGAMAGGTVIMTPPIFKIFDYFHRMSNTIH